MVKMEFKKTDLKSRLLSGSYKKEDEQASACSTNTSQKTKEKSDVDMFGENDTEGKRTEPKMGYFYCCFTIIMFITLSIFVAA